LLVNLKALQETIDRNRPSGAKGRYWRTMYVSATMGPSIQLDINALRDLKFTDAVRRVALSEVIKLFTLSIKLNR